jgi:aryl-alcohol dehydrogenase-like predicted oxidoreductase
MKYNRLGNSGLLTSDLTLGTMIFGETNGRGTSVTESERIIHAYLDAGGNHIDTANAYASGVSEEIVGNAIKTKRNQVILATKINFPMGKGVNDYGLSRYSIMQEVENCLNRLQTDRIDLLYMHCIDPLTPLEESLRAFDDLVSAGKVRYIGVSNFKAWQLMKALGLSDKNGWAKFIAGQYQYSLVKRDIEFEFLDLCESEGVGITPWSPLGGGFLSGKYKRNQRPSSYADGRIGGMSDDVEESWERRSTERNWNIIDAVGKVAEERNASYAQIAIAWLRAQPVVSSTIIGVRTMQQLEDNLGAAEIDLSPYELDILNTASQMPEMYPYRFIENYARKK